MPSKYADFADVSSPKLAAELPENMRFNDYAIILVDDWQLLHSLIHSLGSVELKSLKAYIENNLANGFIRPFMSPTGGLILFDKKSDGSLRMYVNYRGLNNPIIKNWYPLSLFGESLDQLSWAWRFTQLNLINTYHRIRIRKGDEWKTAFRTRYGYFNYQVMLFRLANILVTFQGYINKILTEKLNIFVIVYLDHIFIYINSRGKKYVEAVQ